MKITDYDSVFTRACERKGGKAAVEALLPNRAQERSGARKKRLGSLGSDRYLAEFTRKVFQSGFVWRVVDQKWDNFEESFWGFDIERLLMMPDEMLERKAQDPKIIRNLTKVRTVLDNARMIADTERREECSFGEFVANWPAQDVTGLWLYLKARGKRLGGNTGPYALRSLGVDTFLLTADVEGYLRAHEIIDTGIGSRTALNAAQDYFNRLQQESGRSLTALSRLVAMSHGTNRIGVSQPD